MAGTRRCPKEAICLHSVQHFGSFPLDIKTAILGVRFEITPSYVAVSLVDPKASANSLLSNKGTRY